jgi:Uma2 family endonuclease
MAAPQLVLPTPRRFKRTEYDRLIELGFFLDERLELIRGSLLRMLPIGPPHATLVSNLAERLLPALLGRAKVSLSAQDESEREPDLYWMVDIAGRSFEIFTEPEGDRYTRSRRVSAGETVSPSAFPDVTVDPRLIFG